MVPTPAQAFQVCHWDGFSSGHRPKCPVHLVKKYHVFWLQHSGPAWPKAFDSNSALSNAEIFDLCVRRGGAAQSHWHQASAHPHGQQNLQTSVEEDWCPKFSHGTGVHFPKSPNMHLLWDLKDKLPVIHWGKFGCFSSKWAGQKVSSSGCSEVTQNNTVSGRNQSQHIQKSPCVQASARWNTQSRQNHTSFLQSENLLHPCAKVRAPSSHKASPTCRAFLVST